MTRKAMKRGKGGDRKMSKMTDTVQEKRGRRKKKNKLGKAI